MLVNEVYIVEDIRTGEVKCVSDMKEMAEMMDNAYVIAKITGKEMKVQMWETKLTKKSVSNK